MPPKSPWKTLSTKTVLDTGFYTISEHEVITPSNTAGKYFVMETLPSVFIVPVTPDNKIVLVNVYRYPTQQWSWEIPAGGCDEGELSEDAAKRELLEETGYKSENLQLLSEVQICNGKSNAMGKVYLAQDIVATGTNKAAEDGIGETAEYSWNEVVAMMKSGEISDAQTLSALSLWMVNRG